VQDAAGRWAAEGQGATGQGHERGCDAGDGECDAAPTAFACPQPNHTNPKNRWINAGHSAIAAGLAAAGRRFAPAVLAEQQRAEGEAQQQRGTVDVPRRGQH
jgi:hypothetical protein